MIEDDFNLEVLRLMNELSAIKCKLKIALEGLELLSSGGEQTGIARTTLEAIKELDSPQEDSEIEK